MDEQRPNPEPTTIEELLAGRRFADLSEDEKRLLGKIHRSEAEDGAQRIADNLNRNVLRK